MIVKQAAAQNGGLRKLMHALGIDYGRAWEQMNRCQGVRVDLLPALTAGGLEEPLRVVADECGYDLMPKMKFLRKPNGGQPRPLRSCALALHHAVSAATEILDKALADNRLSEREKEQIAEALFKVNKVKAEVEDMVRRAE
ncbi:MAG: hypothetical protein ABFD80_06950 [Acidobacteriota bacterium]